VLLGAAHNGALGKIAGLVAVGLLAAMIVAPHANGQAALDQYQQPTVPGGGGTAGVVGGGGSQNADGTNAAGIGAVAGETGSGSGGGGTLPFTGYPVTLLVLIALALLCAGVLVRWAVQATRRMRA
jgi:hypothetical protein